MPALLVASLGKLPETSGVVYSTVFGIRPSEHAVYHNGRDEWFEYQISLFTKEQFQAVIAFLSLFINDDPKHLTFVAARAFRFGWDRVENEDRGLFHAFYERMHTWKVQ